jgi:hypothetical protein
MKRSGICGQSGCQCGSWISNHSAGAGNRSGIEGSCGAEGNKYASRLLFKPYQAQIDFRYNYDLI